MWKIILIVILSSCGQAPKMKKKVKVWNGTPEYTAICREGPDTVARKLNMPLHFSRMIVEEVSKENLVCIHATDVRFKSYGCMSWEDIGVIQEYIEILKNKCAKWKK